jgi:hypothetical protein
VAVGGGFMEELCECGFRVFGGAARGVVGVGGLQNKSNYCFLIIKLFSELYLFGGYMGGAVVRQVEYL